MAGEHVIQLEQARQQAVAEYCAKVLSETDTNLSDTSLLMDLQASNAVSSGWFCALYQSVGFWAASAMPAIINDRCYCGEVCLFVYVCLSHSCWRYLM